MRARPVVAGADEENGSLEPESRNTRMSGSVRAECAQGSVSLLARSRVIPTRVVKWWLGLRCSCGRCRERLAITTLSVSRLPHLAQRKTSGP